MLIYAIDDEKSSLNLLSRAIKAAAPEAELRAFGRASEALSAVRARCPDAVFCDIEMPGMTGLELAMQIKTACPGAKIAFVTGYSRYAAEAFRLHARGYILKPVTPERIQEELEEWAVPESGTGGELLRVQCFGNFEVYWHGEPLRFERRQTKELLAYLVDREGAVCSAGEISAALWEDGECVKDAGAYLRVLTNDLKAALTAIGMERALIRKRNQWAVRTELLECDYYRMKAGDMSALNRFQGEYMSQYSWAELTAAKLQGGAFS